jgi:predicted RNA binding protein YcfA (HicA-like mRNA interferase family)
VKLPRDVSGDRLIRHLCRNWGYRQVSQVGSHVILVTESPIHHRIPVPRHASLGIGIFKTILSEVCRVKGIEQESLLVDL